MADFQKIDKFEVTGKLGQGSFGVVYKGRDPFLKRDVAIKVCTVDDAGLRQRFFREAEIAGRLEHRNIVSVFTFGFQDGVPFLVQEFLEGEDLRQALERGLPMSGVQRLDILLQVAEGLAYAHEQGVIHRDVKPANIRLVSDGRVKVIDFGIAKLASDESQLTQKGVTMGTASYLPPEQVRGGETDFRADIFSFGVLAYELFTGERPFRGKTISALVYQILYKPPAPVSQLWPECPREVSELLAKCLEKQPEARFPNLRELIVRLAAIRDAAVAGRLPALQVVHAPKKRDLDNTVSGDVLSNSVISRTAKEVVGQGSSGDLSSELPTLEAPRRDNPELPTLPSKATLGPAGSGAAKPTRQELDELPTLEAPRKGGPNPSLGTQRVPMMMAPGAEAFPSLGGATGGPTAPPLPSSAATQRMAMPPLPDGDPVVEFDDLATSAHEISRLVAEGNLSGAMEQLEETMNRQRVPAPPLPPAASAAPVVAAPAATIPPGARVDEWQPTAKIEVDPKLRKQPPVPPPAAVSAPVMVPPPPLPLPPLPAPAAPAPVQQAPGRPPAAVPGTGLDASSLNASTLHGTQPGTGSNSAPTWPGPPPPAYPPPHPPGPTAAPAAYPPPGAAAGPPAVPARPAGGSSKLPLLIGGLVFGLLVVVVLGFFLLRGKPAEVKEAPVVETPAPPPAAPVGSTQLAVVAKPWGLVTGIVDAEGKAVSVPSASTTPLVVTVAGGGTYTVTVTRPESGEKGECTATVAEGALATCQVLLTEAGATANELFKESGWWK